METMPKPSNGPLPSFLVKPEIPSPEAPVSNLDDDDDDDDDWRVTEKGGGNVTIDPETLNSESSAEVEESPTREKLKEFRASKSSSSSEWLG